MCVCVDVCECEPLSVFFLAGDCHKIAKGGCGVMSQSSVLSKQYIAKQNTEGPEPVLITMNDE